MFCDHMIKIALVATLIIIRLFEDEKNWRVSISRYHNLLIGRGAGILRNPSFLFLLPQSSNFLYNRLYD